MASETGRRPRTPRPVAADVDVYGLTHAGRVRTDNHDHFLVASLHKLLRIQQTSLPEPDLTQLVSETRGYLFLVADGVGGRPGGGHASGTALRSIAAHVTDMMDLYRRVDPDRETLFITELTQSVRRTHAVLLREAEREYGGEGVATTLTMVAVLWPRAYLVQVGDSRCYRLRGDRLERMTRDQTLAQALLDAGALTADQAEASPLRNVLTSALGGREVQCLTAITDCEWDDVVLLCSDGLTKHVTEDEIGAELRRIQSAEASCRALVDLALQRGGSDNVTVLIGRLRPRGEGGG